MPHFDTMLLEEAVLKASTGRRAEITKEYLGYIDQLGEGQAGRLRVGESETVATVRRRLGAAAKVSGKNLVIRRVGDELLFWTEPGKRPANGRRRGRRAKSA